MYLKCAATGWNLVVMLCFEAVLMRARRSCDRQGSRRSAKLQVAGGCALVALIASGLNRPVGTNDVRQPGTPPNEPESVCFGR
jgi:hypothetical protein